MTERRRLKVLLYRPPWRRGEPYFRAQQVAAHFRRVGDRVRVVAGPKGWRGLVRLLLWPWHLIWADLVLLYPQPLMPIFALTAAWLGRRVVIDHYVSYVRMADVSPGVARWLSALERAAYRRADAVLAHTATLAQEVKEAFALAKGSRRLCPRRRRARSPTISAKVHTIYCLVDTACFLPVYDQQATCLRCQLHLDEKFVVLYHGLWHSWHGLETLRAAVARLAEGDAAQAGRAKRSETSSRRRGSDPRSATRGSVCEDAPGAPIALVLIGRQGEGAAHERLLDEVAFDELPAYVQMADLWCSGFASSPRGDRSLSSTLIQALAMARPVITSPSLEKSRWLRDGETAFFVAPGDVAALAKAIDRCRLQPDVARAVGQAGRRLAQESFDIAALHELLDDLTQTWFGE